jgi:hypothetical protein
VENERQGRLWVTPIYQHRRGDRNLDAVGPVFFRTHDTRDESRGLVLAPLFWHFSDPANDSLVIFPFVGRWFHEGISSTWVMPLAGRYKSFERDEQTWWVFPTFEYGWTEDSEKFNIHPLLYSKRSPQKTYLAVAPFYFNFRNHEAKTHRFTLFPLYWDFKNFEKKDRGIALFPLYWDFRDGRRETHRSVFFPLYWDFKDKRNDKRTIHALPLYTRWVRGGVDRQLILNSTTRSSASRGNLCAGSTTSSRSSRAAASARGAGGKCSTGSRATTAAARTVAPRCSGSPSSSASKCVREREKVSDEHAWASRRPLRFTQGSASHATLLGSAFGG